jgi:hypothetical protein
MFTVKREAIGKSVWAGLSGGLDVERVSVKGTSTWGAAARR